jgi:hypothetical protein
MPLMPAEIRHLVFTKEELVTALRAYALKSGTKFPETAEASLSLAGGHRPAVQVQCGSRRNGSSLHFSGQELVAPLILFCNKKRIPLPVRGQKELTVMGGKLVLIVQLI